MHERPLAVTRWTAFSPEPMAPATSKWRSPEFLLLVMAAAFPLSFATWQALLNNFAIERAAFSGADMGWLQSLREVPGFLAFTAVFALVLLREQTLAVISLAMLGVGVVLTGLFPSIAGLYMTTFVMSIGFHYSETYHQSLTLQWLPKDRAPQLIGRQMAARSAASIVAFGLVWFLLERGGCSYAVVYGVGGGLTLALVLFMAFAFPRFEGGHPQHKKLIFRKRYWLYYALTFMGGARRQIFVVFAAFLLVERFGFSAANVALLLLANHAFNMWLAPRVGGWVSRWGERRALIVEYVGLIAVFSCYAFAQSAWFAASLFIIDHLLFALAIAHKTYFQKIADPADLASTAGVAFTINHIAAVVLPAALGLVWISSPAAVFLCGAAMAVVSLVLACNVPRDPRPGREVLFGRFAPHLT